MLLSWTTAFAAVLCYCFLRHLYRLTFHPLSKIPGPKLAALSYWYEFYYDVICRGRYYIKINELHEKYGPIIRINPDEVHILDSQVFHSIYAPQSGPKPEKCTSFYGFASLPNCAFSTGPNDLHRLRRASMAKFFSPKAVAQLEPKVTERVEALSGRFCEAAETGEVVNIDQIMNAVSMDVISFYCFGQHTDYVADKDWAIRWREMTSETVANGPFFRHIPLVPTILKKLPKSILQTERQLRKFSDWREMMVSIVDKILADKDPKSSSAFHAIRDNEELPPSERGRDRLIDEAFFFTAAGIDTIVTTFVATIFHVIDNKEVHRTLVEELTTAMPDPDKIMVHQELKKLPYLSGCIQEGLRIAASASSRLSRVIAQPVVYKDYVIKPGALVSQSLIDVSFDPEIFPEPRKFVPERWSGEKGKELDRFQMAFGKGNRACLGSNLALSQLYLVLATLFRRFKFELHETEAKHIEVYHDYFVPQPISHEGLRVKVSRA